MKYYMFTSALFSFFVLSAAVAAPLRLWNLGPFSTFGNARTVNQPTTHFLGDVSSHAANMGAPVAQYPDGSPILPYSGGHALSRIDPLPAKGMTVFFTYYIPTAKCDQDFYCRAHLSAKQNFAGGTTITFGYDIWSFAYPNAKIPASTTSRILATTPAEISAYIKALGHAVYTDYPYASQLCDLAYEDATSLFEKAMKGMANCKVLSGTHCGVTESVAKASC